MAEYLIRTKDGDWPAIHADRLAAALAPEGSGCQPVLGYGDLRLTCGAATVAFSGEDSGWQVSVDGIGEHEADRLVEVFTQRVSVESGQPCTWLGLG